MANLSAYIGNDFNANEIPEMEEFTVLPEGQYVTVITASEFKPTKDGTGEFLKITHEILDGPYKGRKLWSLFNLKNKNPQAVDMARRDLAGLARACGIIKPVETSEFHNKIVLVDVVVRLDSKNRQGNQIKKFYPASTDGATSMSAQTPVATPTNNTAAPQAAANDVAPWLR